MNPLQEHYQELALYCGILEKYFGAQFCKVVGDGLNEKYGGYLLVLMLDENVFFSTLDDVRRFIAKLPPKS